MSNDQPHDTSSLTLRAWRKERGLTQEELAELSGMSVGNLSQIETGRHSTSVKTLQAIADALGIEVVALFMDPQDYRLRLSPAQRTLLEAARHLDDEQLAKLTSFLLDMVQNARRQE